MKFKDTPAVVRKLDYVTRAISSLNFCNDAEHECYFGTEQMLPEFRITIPTHLRRDLVDKLLAYYKVEYKDILQKLNDVDI